jgi:hypothetical protein
VGGGGVAFELLRVDARRCLSAQPGWLLAGVAGPLALCLHTILRPFDLRASYGHLVQCAIWLAGWYTAFTIFYTVAGWLRPLRPEAEAELRHLPLGPLHFLLRRWIELGLLPLVTLVLSLPFWLAVLAYSGVPYGQQWAAEEWLWNTGGTFLNLWSARVIWATLAMVGGLLLPLGFVLWLDATLRPALLRIPALLGLAIGGYFGVARLAAGYGQWSADYGPLIMCYRQTRGYHTTAFLLAPGALLLLALLSGLLPRGLRIGLALLAGLGAAVLLLLPLLPRGDLLPLREALDTPCLRDLRQGVAFSLGHLSAPKNVRLIFGSLRSNVLLTPGASVIEPAYPYMESDPKLSEAENSQRWEKAYSAYQAAMGSYARQISALPRLPLWFGAGLWPLLLGLLAPLGILLRHALQRQPLRDAD